MRKIAVAVLLTLALSINPWTNFDAKALTVCPGGDCQIIIDSIAIHLNGALYVDDDTSPGKIDVPFVQVDPGKKITLEWTTKNPLETVAHWEVRYGLGDIPSVIISDKVACAKCGQTNLEFTIPKTKAKYLKFWIWAYDNQGVYLGGANSRPISLSKTFIPPIGYVNEAQGLSQSAKLTGSIVEAGNIFPLKCWFEIRKPEENYLENVRWGVVSFASAADVKKQNSRVEFFAPDLERNTRYVCRFVLTSLAGEYISPDKEFTTLIDDPKVMTDWPTEPNIRESWWNGSENSFTMNATLLDWGGDDHFYFYFEGSCLNSGISFVEPAIPQRIERKNKTTNKNQVSINWKVNNIQTGRLYQYRVVVFNSTGNLVKGDYKYLSPNDGIYHAQIRTDDQQTSGYISATLCGTVLDLGNQDSVDVTFQVAVRDPVSGIILRPIGKIKDLKTSTKVNSVPQQVKMRLDNIYDYFRAIDGSGYIYRIKAVNAKYGLTSYGEWDFLTFTSLLEAPVFWTKTPDRKRDIGNNWINLRGMLVSNWQALNVWFEIKQNGSTTSTWKTIPQAVIGDWYAHEYKQTVRDGDISSDGRKIEIKPGTFYEYKMFIQVLKEECDPEFVIARGEKYFSSQESKDSQKIRTWFGKVEKQGGKPKIKIEAKLSGFNTIYGVVTIEDFANNDYVLIELESYQYKDYSNRLINPSYGQCQLQNKSMPDPNGKGTIDNPDYGTSAAHYAPGYQPVFTFSIPELLYGTDFAVIATGQGNSGNTGFSDIKLITTQSPLDEDGQPVMSTNPKLSDYFFIPTSLDLDYTTHTGTAQFDIKVVSMGSHQKFQMHLDAYEVDVGERADTEKTSETLLVEKCDTYHFTINGLKPGHGYLVRLNMAQGKFYKSILCRLYENRLPIELPYIPPDAELLPASEFIYNNVKSTFIVGAKITYPGSADDYAFRFAFGWELDPSQPGKFEEGAILYTPWRTKYSGLNEKYFYDELIYTTDMEKGFKPGKKYVVYLQYKDLQNGIMTNPKFVRFEVPKT